MATLHKSQKVAGAFVVPENCGLDREVARKIAQWLEGQLGRLCAQNDERKQLGNSAGNALEQNHFAGRRSPR